jgi:hypothetical protein
MLVKMKVRIAGIEVGRIVSVSELRGIGWIERGYASFAGPEEVKKQPIESPVKYSAAIKQPVVLTTPHTGQPRKGKRNG